MNFLKNAADDFNFKPLVRRVGVTLCAIIAIFAVGAIILGTYDMVSRFSAPPTESTQVENVLVSADENQVPAQPALVPQLVLDKAGKELAESAKDFGNDCAAAEGHYTTTRVTTRCKQAGMEMIYSDTSLPADPGENVEAPLEVKRIPLSEWDAKR